jgi:hypothetical protein
MSTMSPEDYRRVLYDKQPVALEATCRLLIAAATSGQKLPHCIDLQEIAAEAKIALPQLHAVKDGVINDLRVAGWFVEYTSDQRGGDYLRFGSLPL